MIRDDDGNLLVARWADTQAWDLPSGTLRVSEDVCTGVRRVVADTVTLGVSVGWLAGIHSYVRDGVALIFLARHVKGRAVAHGEVSCADGDFRRRSSDAVAAAGRAVARRTAGAATSTGGGPRKAATGPP